MKSLVNLKRIVVMVAVILISTTAAFAQTVKKHIVERGETLASIAGKYKVTKEDIINLNPDAAQFVYVGMELKIPVGEEVAKEITSEVINNDNRGVYEDTKEYSSKQSYDNTSYDLLSFSNYGVGYRASFKDAGHGVYGLGGSVYSSCGVGFDLFLGANYGLVDSDYAGGTFFIGPCYGYNIKNVLLSVSFDFVGQYMGQGEKQMEGTNKKGEKYSYVGTDFKFTWGLAFTPKIGLKLNKIMPYCGIDLLWNKDVKEIEVGFVLGVGFDL